MKVTKAHRLAFVQEFPFAVVLIKISTYNNFLVSGHLIQYCCLLFEGCGH